MDLADQIDDYICSFDGIGDIAMDSLVMFVFIWAVLALFIVWLCKFLYNKYINKEQTTANSTNVNSVALNGASKLLNGDKPVRLSSEPRDILASKEVKEISSKPLGGIPGAGRGRSGSGHFASGGVGGVGGGGGGQLRKRLVRQSSSGPETRKKRNVPPPSNVVGPETSSVTWTSQVFRWLYSDLVIVNDLLNSWVQAMNETLKKSVVEHGVGVEVVRVLPDSPAPLLSNLFCNSDENNPADMIITCDCDAMPVLQVKTYRQKSGKVDTSHYKVTVSRFRARLAAPMNYNSLKGEMKVEGYPDIRIAMNSVGPIKPIDQDEQQLQEVISEILTTTLRDTVYPIDFSIYLTCPRAEIEIPEIPVNLPIHYDTLAHNMENLNSALQNQYFSNGQSMTSGKRLLVKILKGDGLPNTRELYCVVEMDEPPQKNQTGTRPGPNPYWDEHFLFDLSQHSAEILFEVYDRSVNNMNDSPKFLGLGLVGIDELTIGPTSSQVLTLQPRPYEEQTVRGSVTIEFVVIEGADVPISPRPNQLTEALKISSPIINEHLRNGSDLADAAVRAIQDGALAPNGKPSKSTLIIHSVQRNQSNVQNPNFKIELNKQGSIEVREVDSSLDNTENQESLSTENLILDETSATNLNASPSNSSIKNLEIPLNEPQTGNETEGNVDEFGRPLAASSPNNLLKHQNGNGNSSNMMPYNSNSLSQGELPGDSADDRGRSKKRNFFGTLKKRLGRSKTRATSADRGMIQINLDNLNGESRSISVDRGVLSKSHSIGAKIVVPTLDQSRRSSISESSAFSGFSSASNKTYVHEASTLVLETIENGVKKHFLVPLAVAQKPKWRRKGTKLHIYNEHTFVAKHLSGSGLQCAICMKSIPRRPGKQGYECRDCQIICHKQCHVRAPQVCPNATILSMELSTLPVLTENDIL